ncbi:PREDICTED: polyadenylate-binding protein 1-B isoform X3 [Tarenaya hassleriana]|uniref:polyadenylate-binding protein 1-B isoform X3 n=1 Tax=Tarenaya hassleriana TaxID=28532 RepID=UPI00053C8855|nr:PREDICTED: polyadenylate-binding protein 1-B isoform X3 [Tarenaya hassleriana]
MSSSPNSTASAAVSRSLTTVSETPATPATVRTPPSQPPPAPPTLHRALAPPFQQHHHPHPFQQAQNLYAQPFPVRQPNSVASSPHQDPSALLYPFTNSGRGFSTRPRRPSSPSVSDPAVTAGNPGGYLPRPVFAYHHRQFGSNHLDPMMQFMRAAHPQMHQFHHLGSGAPVGSGPIRGIPHFLQPRVAPPSSSILDNTGHKNGRSRDEALVLVRGRKRQSNDTLKSLPKPLPVHMMESSPPKDSTEELNEEDNEDEEAVKKLSEKDLLKRHVARAKKVRARLREERLRRIARYKARLALLLPPAGEQCRND